MDEIGTNCPEMNCLLDLMRQYKKTLRRLKSDRLKTRSASSNIFRFTDNANQNQQTQQQQQQRKCSCDSPVNAAASGTSQCGWQLQAATNESSNTDSCGVRRVYLEPSEIRLTLKLDTWLSDTGTLVIRPSICGDASAGESSVAQQAILAPVNAVQCGGDKLTKDSRTGADAPTHPHLVQLPQSDRPQRNLNDHLQRPDRGLATGVATSSARRFDQDDSQANNHHDNASDQQSVQSESDSLSSNSGSCLQITTISISPDADCDTSAQPQDQDRIVTSTVALIHRLHEIVKSDASAAGMGSCP